MWYGAAPTCGFVRVVFVYFCLSVKIMKLICQEGDIPAGPLTFAVNELGRMPLSLPIRSLKEIPTGSLTLTASELLQIHSAKTHETLYTFTERLKYA